MPDDTPELIAARDRVHQAVDTLNELTGNAPFTYTPGSSPKLTIPGMLELTDSPHLGLENGFRRDDIDDTVDEAATELLYALEHYGDAAAVALVTRPDTVDDGTVTLREYTNDAIMAALTQRGDTVRTEAFNQLDTLSHGQMLWLLDVAGDHDVLALNDNEYRRVLAAVRHHSAQVANGADALRLINRAVRAAVQQLTAGTELVDDTARMWIEVADRDDTGQVYQKMVSTLCDGVPIHGGFRRPLGVTSEFIGAAHAAVIASGVQLEQRRDLRLHNNAPGELIASYVAEHPGQLHTRAMQQKNTPTAVLAQLWQVYVELGTRAGIGNPLNGTEAGWFANHPNTPAAVLDELSKSTDRYIRADVAANPSTALPTLMELAGKTPSSIQRAALRHRKVAGQHGYGTDDRYQRWERAVTRDYKGTPAKLAAQLDAA